MPATPARPFRDAGCNCRLPAGNCRCRRRIGRRGVRKFHPQHPAERAQRAAQLRRCRQRFGKVRVCQQGLQLRAAARCFRNQRHQPGLAAWQRCAVRFAAGGRAAGPAADGVAAQRAVPVPREQAFGLGGVAADAAPDENQQRPGEPAQIPVLRDQAAEQVYAEREAG